MPVMPLVCHFMLVSYQWICNQPVILHVFSLCILFLLNTSILLVLLVVTLTPAPVLLYTSFSFMMPCPFSYWMIQNHNTSSLWSTLVWGWGAGCWQICKQCKVLLYQKPFWSQNILSHHRSCAEQTKTHLLRQRGEREFVTKVVVTLSCDSCCVAFKTSFVCFTM